MDNLGASPYDTLLWNHCVSSLGFTSALLTAF